MKLKTKFFGTDGIRGRVGVEPITADWILRLGHAIGQVLVAGGRGKVLIGKDTRISGYMLESALEAGLSAAGMDTLLLGPMPTPGVAYLTRTLQAEAGIIVSASHNDFGDNGVKLFSSQGTKFQVEMEQAIEHHMSLPMKTVEASQIGRAARVTDAPGRYIEFCKSTFPAGYQLKGLKLVVDCAHGATYHIAPNVFKELGAQVVPLHVEPDGFNINAGCGSTQPGHLVSMVLKEKADFGIALDGDGDRLIMVDHKGQVVDGDELLFIIARWYLATQRLRGGVVGTFMSNLGLEQGLQALGVPFVRTAIGDKYILERLLQEGWNLGGESSGHILCLDAHTTGDGIISALRVLAAACYFERSLAELATDMKKYPQTLINVPVERPFEVERSPVIQQALQGACQRLGNKGRVLLRPSGTEPVMRVMVEGIESAQVYQVATELAEVIQKESGGLSALMEIGST